MSALVLIAFALFIMAVCVLPTGGTTIAMSPECQRFHRERSIIDKAERRLTLLAERERRERNALISTNVVCQPSGAGDTFQQYGIETHSHAYAGQETGIPQSR